jgi:hypothetical protein
MQISEYRIIPENERKGATYATFTITNPKQGNFLIRNMKEFHKNTNRWIGFPQFKNHQGQFENLAGYQDKALDKKFLEKALETLDEYLKAHPELSKPNVEELSLFPKEEIPGVPF